MSDSTPSTIASASGQTDSGSILALTRAVSPRIAECELTHLARVPIDLERAREQHRAYEQKLRELGAIVERVAPSPDHPDSVFVEDTAVVLDEVAVLARPGAASRRGEVDAVAAALGGRRPIVRIEAPCTLDGGDVLVIGRTVFVGRSTRTSDEGIAQLAGLLDRFGYRTIGVPVRGCLHLKTAAAVIADDAVLVQPRWVDRACFAGLEVVEVDPDVPAPANVLRVGDALVVPEAHARTRARLEARGHRVHTVPADELAKAEAGLTCCSILLRV